MRKDESDALSGTTLKVYRFLYKQGARPVSLHDIQRGLKLSSASLAQYHVRKLLDADLVKEQDSGYVVDRVLFENMVRVRRSIVPLQVTFCAFFVTTFVLLLTLFRPDSISGTYVFSVVINVCAIGLFGYEGRNASKKSAL